MTRVAGLCGCPPVKPIAGFILYNFRTAMSGRNFRENVPKRRTFVCRGIVALPAAVKAHTAPHVGDTGGGLSVLVGSVPLYHEFLDTLLLSRNVHSLKLLLIKLFHD